MDLQRVIYGKNDLQNIVGIEPKDGSAEIFIEKDGKVESVIKPNVYWILMHEPNGPCAQLRGNQFFKYGRQFKTREEFNKFRMMNRNRDIYSVYDPKEALMLKDGYTYFKGMAPKDVSVLSFDLETTGLDPYESDAQIILLSTTLRKNGEIIKRLFSYDEYESEGAMIEDFCSYIRDMNPTCLIGHNIYSFDLPYIIGRATVNEVSVSLGRDGSEPDVATYTANFRLDGTRDLHYNKIRIYGREIIDTMFLAYKYDIGKKYESYGLKNIIKQEGLEKKDRVFYDAMQIRFNYKDPVEFEKIKAYCVDDSDDALALYDLMIPAFFYMTQAIPKSFQSVIESASGSQINGIMIRAYLQDAHGIPKATQFTEQIKGGISFGIPGIYSNVVKWDIKSAYPHQILRLKLHDKEKDPEAILYKITEFFTKERLKVKELKKKNPDDENLEAMDLAYKSFINSMYGVTATPGLNFNCPHIGAIITGETREVIKKALVWASGKTYEYWDNFVSSEDVSDISDNE